MTTPSPRPARSPRSPRSPRPLLLPMSLALCVALVLHWAALGWLQANLPVAQPLASMAEPMFTRLLEPSAPQSVAPTPAPVPTPALTRKRNPQARTVAKPATPAAPATPATPAVIAALVEEPTLPTPSTTPDVPASVPPGEAATDPAPESSTPTPAPAGEPASVQAPDNIAANPLDRWPADTRLSYRLGGFYKGELYGSARVQWQREKAPGPPAANPALPAAPAAPAARGVNYQVMLTVKAAGLTLATLTSQGEATATGLVPRIYEEQVPGGLRRAEFTDGQVKFQNGNVALLPFGAQDTVSQFVELAHRFSTGREKLAAGAPVRVWLARPGGLDEWIYDVGAEETLQTPELGAIQAFHLTPRPLVNPRGAITAELWFAPSLQYLPVRVRIVLGGGDFVDLMIERIEQAEGAPTVK